MMQLESIYLEYREKVYGYLLKRTNNSAVAEDLCSDVFLKITANLHRFDESKSSLSTWIYNITRNTLFDYYRTNHEVCELDETLATGDDFAEKLCTEGMLERLANALETLPERERELIIRRYYYGEKLKDIAERFEVSKSYIYVLQEAALAKLKKYFEI